MIQVDNMQIRDNLTYEISPLQIEDREVKHLRSKEIILVKVVLGGSIEGSAAWELESQMNEFYSSCYSQVNFRGWNFYKWKRVL